MSNADAPNTVMHVHQQKPPGVIRADEVYTINEFCRRSGLGDYAFRQARRDGLRVVEVGKKRFVRGADWLGYLDQIAASETNG